jgi:Mor family transcriptional regulator
MGKPTQPETIRNQSIYNDFKSGVSYIDMVHKYQLSSQRLWQIIKREEGKETK